MVEADDLPSSKMIRAETALMSLSQFKAVYRQPALHLTVHFTPRPGRGDSKSTAERSYERTTTLSPGLVPVERYNDRIAFLAKRDGNPFPNMISVGRALNNDLVVMLSTVSKLHGYFMLEPRGWTFADHGSRNGTRINDEALEPGARRPLRDGDRIRLGLELHAVFFGPEGLYGFLRRSSSSASP